MSGPPLLYLTEGDAETWGSWSGSSRSIVRALRAAGREVRTGDVEVRGPLDLAGKLLAFHPNRARWAERYHNGTPGFALRSRAASRHVAAHPANAPVMQIGAGFMARPGPRPRYCFCDGNAAHAARSGPFSPLASLSDGDVRRLIAREAEVYAGVTAVFAMTERLRQSFITDFGVPADRVITTHAGPNLEVLPDERDLTTPKHPQPTVLFVGKQFERKGGPEVVRAFAKVRAAVPDARLVIVGAQPAMAAGQPGVEVLGFVPRESAGGESLKQLFLTSDVFCMPSHYEPFGVVFPEAMMHGLACIAPPESEIIEEGRTGWLVAAGDQERLAGRMIEALRDRAATRALGLAARKRAQEKFTWARVAGIINERLVQDARS